MSCIRFNTPAQRAQLDALKADKKLNETAVAKFLGPEFGESKINRLRSMAKDKNEGVRICVARNETTPCDILRHLATDKSEQVRSWVAVNFFVPQDTMELLATDKSESVRKLVAWKADLAEKELVSA